MASKGYTTTGEVGVYMGREFDSIQAAMCELMIEAAEERLDEATRHAWLEQGPITEDIIQPTGLYINLKKPPIIDIVSIAVTGYPGADPIALTPECGGGYFVQSLRDGKIVVPFAHHAFSVQVIYNPNVDDVPADIRLATTALAASNLSLSPMMLDNVDPSIIQAYVVGGELEVTFRKNLMVAGLPQSVMQYLDRWIKNYTIV